eukprot:1760081-Amphidinium_carterae.1
MLFNPNLTSTGIIETTVPVSFCGKQGENDQTHHRTAVEETTSENTPGLYKVWCLVTRCVAVQPKFAIEHLSTTKAQLLSHVAKYTLITKGRCPPLTKSDQGNLPKDQRNKG